MPKNYIIQKLLLVGAYANSHKDMIESKFGLDCVSYTPKNANIDCDLVVACEDVSEKMLGELKTNHSSLCSCKSSDVIGSLQHYFVIPELGTKVNRKNLIYMLCLLYLPGKKFTVSDLIRRCSPYFDKEIPKPTAFSNMPVFVKAGLITKEKKATYEMNYLTPEIIEHFKLDKGVIRELAIPVKEVFIDNQRSFEEEAPKLGSEMPSDGEDIAKLIDRKIQDSTDYLEEVFKEHFKDLWQLIGLSQKLSALDKHQLAKIDKILSIMEED